MTPASDPSRRAVRDVPVAATVCLVAIGLLFTALAIVYFAEPAHDLPGLIPGSDKDLTRHHLKHGLASLAAGLAALLAAGFSAGQRPAATPAQRAARRAAESSGALEASDGAGQRDAEARRAAELQREDDLLWDDGSPASSSPSLAANSAGEPVDPPAGGAGKATEETPSVHG
jgi:hypothetical protein